MLDLLATFTEVCRQGSMGGAARVLGISQPTVGARIAALEAQLGTVLLVRSRAGVSPTWAGRALRADIGKRVDDLADIIDDHRPRAGSDMSGIIRLGAPTALFSERGHHLVSALSDTHIRLQITLGGRRSLYAGLSAGVLDMALTASPPDDPGLDSHVIGAETLIAVSHPDVDRLRGAPLIAYDEDADLAARWLDANGRAFVPPVHTVADLRAIARLVTALRAWAVLPEYLVAPGLADGRLRRHAGASPSPNPFHLVWRRAALRTPRIAHARRVWTSQVGLEA